MKTKIKPIVSWGIWAGGLSLVMGIVTRQHMVAGFRADETGMSIVIAAVFAAGLVVSFLSALQLHAEWGEMAKIKASGKLPKGTGHSDLASTFQKLSDYKEKGERIEIQTVVDSYYAKHNSRVRSVSIMAALVISMGLLGTVVGLIMSISGLGGMVENIGLSRATMMDALKTTVAGMGTAFYTTFFGALGGLILRAVAVSQLNSLSELCAEATEYADAHLVPRFESKEEELNQQVSKVIAGFERMQREIDALSPRIAASIESALSKFGESIASIGIQAMESTQAAVAGMTEQMAEFKGSVGDSFGQFNAAIGEAGEGLRDAMGSVNAAIGASQESLNSSFASLSATLGEAGGQVSEAFGSLNGSVKQASDTVSTSLVDFKLAIEGTSLELNEAVGELHTAIGRATGEMSTMAEARLDTDASAIAGHLSLAADSIQQFLQRKSVRSEGESNQKVA